MTTASTIIPLKFNSKRISFPKVLLTDYLKQLVDYFNLPQMLNHILFLKNKPVRF